MLTSTESAQITCAAAVSNLFLPSGRAS